jgi:hypothetical protein
VPAVLTSLVHRRARIERDQVGMLVANIGETGGDVVPVARTVPRVLGQVEGPGQGVGAGLPDECLGLRRRLLRVAKGVSALPQLVRLDRGGRRPQRDGGLDRVDVANILDEGRRPLDLLAYRGLPRRRGGRRHHRRPGSQNGRHRGGECEEDRHNESSLLGLLGLGRRLAGSLPIDFLHCVGSSCAPLCVPLAGMIAKR